MTQRTFGHWLWLSAENSIVTVTSYRLQEKQSKVLDWTQ